MSNSYNDTSTYTGMIMIPAPCTEGTSPDPDPDLVGVGVAVGVATLPIATSPLLEPTFGVIENQESQDQEQQQQQQEGAMIVQNNNNDIYEFVELDTKNKMKSEVWNYFFKSTIRNNITRRYKGQCKYCLSIVDGRPPIMARHLLNNCVKKPFIKKSIVRSLHNIILLNTSTIDRSNNRISNEKKNNKNNNNNNNNSNNNDTSNVKPNKKARLNNSKNNSNENFDSIERTNNNNDNDFVSNLVMQQQQQQQQYNAIYQSPINYNNIQNNMDCLDDNNNNFHHLSTATTTSRNEISLAFLRFIISSNLPITTFSTNQYFKEFLFKINGNNWILLNKLLLQQSLPLDELYTIALTHRDNVLIQQQQSSKASPSSSASSSANDTVVFTLYLHQYNEGQSVLAATDSTSTNTYTYTALTLVSNHTQCTLVDVIQTPTNDISKSSGDINDDNNINNTNTTFVSIIQQSFVKQIPWIQWKTIKCCLVQNQQVLESLQHHVIEIHHSHLIVLPCANTTFHTIMNDICTTIHVQSTISTNCKLMNIILSSSTLYQACCKWQQRQQQSQQKKSTTKRRNHINEIEYYTETGIYSFSKICAGIGQYEAYILSDTITSFNNVLKTNNSNHFDDNKELLAILKPILSMIRRLETTTVAATTASSESSSSTQPPIITIATIFIEMIKLHVHLKSLAQNDNKFALIALRIVSKHLQHYFIKQPIYIISSYLCPYYKQFVLSSTTYTFDWILRQIIQLAIYWDYSKVDCIIIKKNLLLYNETNNESLSTTTTHSPENNQYNYRDNQQHQHQQQHQQQNSIPEENDPLSYWTSIITADKYEQAFVKFCCIVFNIKGHVPSSDRIFRVQEPVRINNVEQFKKLTIIQQYLKQHQHQQDLVITTRSESNNLQKNTDDSSMIPNLQPTTTCKDFELEYKNRLQHVSIDKAKKQAGTLDDVEDDVVNDNIVTEIDNLFDFTTYNNLFQYIDGDDENTSSLLKEGTRLEENIANSDNVDENFTLEDILNV